MASQSSQTTAYDDDAISVISSAISTAPATSILDQIDDDLGGMGPQAQETLADAGQPSARAPKQCYYNGQLYIEIAVDRKRNSAWYWAHGKAAWYWAHGKEFECQTPNK
jgi:hypothetical protein